MSRLSSYFHRSYQQHDNNDNMNSKGKVATRRNSYDMNHIIEISCLQNALHHIQRVYICSTYFRLYADLDIILLDIILLEFLVPS